MLDDTIVTETLIIEYVNFLKLKKLDSDAPKNLLIDHYMRRHDNLELAEKQARIAIEFLEKMGRREFDFRKRYKDLKKSIGSVQTNQDCDPDNIPVGSDHSLGHLI